MGLTKWGLTRSGLIRTRKTLQKSQAFKANNIFTCDNQMIVQRYRDQRQCGFQLIRYLNVGAGRFGLAAGMIMDQNHGTRMMAKRAVDHLANIDGRLINGAF